MPEERGILFAFITALVSGVSVFVNGFAVKGFDPFVFTALKNVGAVVLLGAAFYMLKERKQLFKLTREQWGWLIAIGLIGGSIPFLLFFQGLALVPAIKGSFIFRLLFIFSAIFAIFMLKEKPSKNVAIGAGIVLAGNAILLGKENILNFGMGETLVLAATVIWGLEYVLSKWVINKKLVEPRFVAFGRMFFGTIFIFAYLGVIGKLEIIPSLSIVHWGWVAITSAFLFLFLSGWYVALKYAKATTATAILTLGGPITAALNYLFLGKAPTPNDAIGLLLISAGIISIVGIAQLSRLPLAAENEMKRLRAWKA